MWIRVKPKTLEVLVFPPSFLWIGWFSKPPWFFLVVSHHPKWNLVFFIWVFPKIVGFHPKSSNFNRVSHYFHHPFWGTQAIMSCTSCDRVGPLGLRIVLGDSTGLERSVYWNQDKQKQGQVIDCENIQHWKYAFIILLHMYILYILSSILSLKLTACTQK